MRPLHTVPGSVPSGVPSGLTTRQVAGVIRLSDSTVKSALDSGSLPFFRVSGGKSWRLVRPADLQNWAVDRGLALHWESAL